MRFNVQGLAGLADPPRTGRPPTYTAEEIGTVIATSLTNPDGLGLPVRQLDPGSVGCLPAGAHGLMISRSRIGEVLQRGGLAVADPGNLVRRAARSRLRRKKGAIVTLYEPPPAGSIVICLDEMGPESAKSSSRTAAHPPRSDRCAAGPGDQEIDYGRRGKGYIFGAFEPATGKRSRPPMPGARSPTGSRSWSRSMPGSIPSVDAGLRDPRQSAAPIGRSTCCSGRLTHPRWEFVFQPTYAAYLNLIEPWWKILRSLALKGRRFATWEEMCRRQSRRATAYWNAHRHPFVWGRRRRHRTPARRALASPIAGAA